MTLTHMKLNYGLWEHLVLVYVAVPVQRFELGFRERDAKSGQPIDKLIHIHIPLENMSWGWLNVLCGISWHTGLYKVMDTYAVVVVKLREQNFHSLSSV